MNKISGEVLRIEKCSIHDGDGLRTVVFLMGCPLRCLWCSTPESWQPGYGKVMDTAEVMKEIAKDEIFYFHSGGGVTLSGGEPLCQPSFAARLLEECKKQGLHTAIETGMSADYECIEALLPWLDLIYADLKHINPDMHKKYTGMTNEGILRNIKSVAGSGFGGKLRIRIPMIPGINTAEENIKKTAEFCGTLAGLDYAELLPYHRLGVETYRRLGIVYPLPDVAPPTAEDLDAARDIFRIAAPNVRVI